MVLSEGDSVAKSVRELEVFIASPSDVAPERQLVRDTIDTVNQTFASDSEFPRLLATGWEQVAPTFGRPQERINELVATCDIFVGILGNRFGSPTGTHESGFLEEYEGAVSRRHREGAPHIALYFRQPAQAMLEDPGTELKRVLDFKKRVQETHEALYGEFVAASDFQGHLRDLLTELVVTNRQRTEQPQGAIATDTLVVTTSPEKELDGAQEQIASTLVAFAALVRQEEVGARLDEDRLLQFSLLFQGEGVVLPVRACNRLYMKRKDMILARGEYSLWLDTVLQQARVSPENAVTPGWSLVTAAGTLPWEKISSEVAARLKACEDLFQVLDVEKVNMLDHDQLGPSKDVEASAVH